MGSHYGTASYLYARTWGHSLAAYLFRMDDADQKAQFALRVHELCDELGIPKGHGRQTYLGKMFDVTPKAARKWLMGLAYPEMALAVRMCVAAEVNLNWFLQGFGPKRGERSDSDTLRLAEGLDRLPMENRQAVLEFMRYEFQRADGWFTQDTLNHYLESIDQLKRRTGNTRSKPLNT